jgi:hypothetical protein
MNMQKKASSSFLFFKQLNGRITLGKKKKGVDFKVVLFFLF